MSKSGLIPDVSGGRNYRLRKPESLDWKRIASADVEKMMTEMDENLLRDFLPQIAFCQPEVEFNSDRTDPGFRKVFRISQLVIEYLVQTQEHLQVSVSTNEEKYSLSELKNQQNEMEIQKLRERLAEARKELKRRKEIIETNQNEILGAGAKDEYEQCPYCTKKFMNPIYLYAHLQRRHQGLPIHPAFNCANTFLMPPQEFAKPGSATDDKKACPNSAGKEVDHIDTEAKKSTISTQTDENAINPLTPVPSDPSLQKPKEIDPGIVNELVEQYLKQRFPESPKSPGNKEVESPNHMLNEKYYKAVHFDLPPSAPSSIELRNTKAMSIGLESVGEIKSVAGEKSIFLNEMKEELESQWKALLDKMHKTELDDLKTTLLQEMQKMRDIIVKSTSTVLPQPSSPSGSSVPPRPSSAYSPVTSALVGKVEERFQKQEVDLEQLKHNLQQKIRTDIEVIESRLESQERFWRAKLRTVEEEYQDHIAKLRKEIQQSLDHERQKRQAQSQVTLTPTKIVWPNAEALLAFQPPIAEATPTVATATLELNTNAVEPHSISLVPQPRPRKFAGLKFCETIISSPIKSPAAPSPKKVLKEMEKNLFHANVDGYSTCSEDTNTSSLFTSLATHSIAPSPHKLAPKPLKNRKTSIDSNTSIEMQNELHYMNREVGISVPAAPAITALETLARQLNELGLSPESTQANRKITHKSLKELEERRKSFSEKVQNFAESRETEKQMKLEQAKTKVLEAKVNAITVPRGIQSKHLQQIQKNTAGPSGQNPFTKVFQAVRNGGTRIKRKMSLVVAPSKTKTKSKTILSPRNRASKFTGVTTIPRSSRKPGPPPPPPLTVATTSKSKDHKIQTIFNSALQRGKKPMQDSVSEFTECTDPPIVKKTVQAPLRPTPKKLLEPSPKDFFTVTRRRSKELDTDELKRKIAIQQNAEKEIKLSTQAAPYYPTISNKEYKSRYEVEKIAVQKFKDDPSEFSSASSSFTEASTSGTERSIGQRNGLLSPQKSARKAIPFGNTGIRTVVHHNPLKGLNEFGLRNRNGGEKVNMSRGGSGSSTDSRKKKLKRLHPVESKKSSNTRFHPVFSKRLPQIRSPHTPNRQMTDRLNEPSDWDSSSYDGSMISPGQSKRMPVSVIAQPSPKQLPIKSPLPSTSNKPGPTRPKYEDPKASWNSSSGK